MANSRDFTGKNRKFTGTKGIVTPKGTTGQRVGSESGELRFNTTTELMEYYDGNQWKPIDAPPTISSISTSDATGSNIILNADGSTLFTITITGGNFSIGVNVKFIGNTGTEYTAGNINRISGSSITCTTLLSMGLADDPYDVQVINTSGLSATLEDAFSYNAGPVFATAANTNIGTAFEGATSYGGLDSIAATDAEGDTVTHTISAGALPTGVSLNTNGTLTGTVGAAQAGTFTFTVQAATTEFTVTRQFFLTVATLPQGGTVTTSGNNRIHTFNSSGDFTTSFSQNVDVLVVGGGGGGAGAFAGGGGAGGVVYATNKAISPATHTVTVGTGGLGGIAWQNIGNMRGATGVDSSAFSLTAKGGGGGGSFQYTYSGNGDITQIGQPGGSGGGGGPIQSTMTNSARLGAASNQANFAGATSYGNEGGDGDGPSTGGYYGGGGGGAGAGGGDATGSAGGAGGNGQAFTITGSSVTYAGGGGGSSQGGPAGAGGSGGGGAAIANTAAAQGGTDNLGGGGGAAGYNGPSNARLGGEGGDGVVIIKYDTTTL